MIFVWILVVCMFLVGFGLCLFLLRFLSKYYVDMIYADDHKHCLNMFHLISTKVKKKSETKERQSEKIVGNKQANINPIKRNKTLHLNSNPKESTIDVANHLKVSLRTLVFPFTENEYTVLRLTFYHSIKDSIILFWSSEACRTYTHCNFIILKTYTLHIDIYRFGWKSPFSTRGQQYISNQNYSG